LERHSKLCLFIGYPKETRGGLFYDPQDEKVIVSTNATFLEEDHIRDHKPRSKLVLEEISKDATDRSQKIADQTGQSTRVVNRPSTSSLSRPSQELREPRRSGRVVRQPDRYLGLAEIEVTIPYDGLEDPLTYKQAMNDVDRDLWIKAMALELESMYFNLV